MSKTESNRNPFQHNMLANATQSSLNPHMQEGMESTRKSEDGQRRISEEGGSDMKESKVSLVPKIEDVYQRNTSSLSKPEHERDNSKPKNMFSVQMNDDEDNYNEQE